MAADETGASEAANENFSRFFKMFGFLEGDLMILLELGCLLTCVAWTLQAT
jgi:hypothetical protein